MVIAGRCWTTITSWQRLPLNLPASQTKSSSVSHALSHGLWGFERFCLLTPSHLQLKKSPQEGSPCRCWCGKKQRRRCVKKKNTQISPHANVSCPSLVVSPLPFSCTSNSNSPLSRSPPHPPHPHPTPPTECLPCPGAAFQDIILDYPLFWEPLANWDQVKCFWARFCQRLYKAFGVFLEQEQKESRMTHNLNRICSPQSLCQAVWSWELIY